MKITINRELILKPLQLVNNCIQTKHQMPILSNVLIKVKNNELILIGTDLEIEMLSKVTLNEFCEEAAITVPAKKLLDIIRAFPNGVDITFKHDKDRVSISSGKSRYQLNTLRAEDFPNLKEFDSISSFEIPQITLKQLIDSTQFSMAQQDIRFYLNGLLLEIDASHIRTVATDGHRLALSEKLIEEPIAPQSVIIPRKSILELIKLLDTCETKVSLKINQGNLEANFGDTIFTTKLIDGKYPDYRRTLPRAPDKVFSVDTETIKQAFIRANVLSTDRYKGVRLILSLNQAVIQTNNPEHEEAEEILDVDYAGPDIEIGLNIVYLLDVLNTIKTGETIFHLTDSVSSVLITDKFDDKAKYVIMPMRL
ncbi:DNA polymerase III subunit beta [Thorsellia kenyensis]|uniref:Beta sliding clamp n=1 Tax=Thorsellia kenyensis TaxID=1549888 RepID=A0ABV6C8Y3_9GAMM